MNPNQKITENRQYRNEEWLREQYMKKNRTQAEIAEECDVSDTTIRHWREKFDIVEPDTAQFSIQTDGYEQWKCEAGAGKADTVLVHRLLATLKINELSELDGKHVHHKTGNRRDNRLENLAVVTPAEHAERHA